MLWEELAALLMDVAMAQYIMAPLRLRTPREALPGNTKWKQDYFHTMQRTAFPFTQFNFMKQHWA
jgi:hypothetical protein